ncbi:aminoglycoside phosphotransferase family protein [Deinococcus ruber]|uniref:Aminoglycoside phosphotransferase n=1 Tax=Deinococcus ruber TaxID=1848197 RepID=A0A918CBV8_9DEIO|nr:aminoglycoside phosphotransferase family protein [Deinococcus ruber]GGR14502.1 aminoglycoside phosphotransferase [Deinococcus ruber]
MTEITPQLVRQLIAEQFPQWAALPVTPVAFGGWDNRTFHLGDELSVRLPSAPRYAVQAEKEHRWLPLLGPHLPLPIPQSLALGQPSAAFAWPWSVRRWLDGEQASVQSIRDQVAFAHALAEFLSALQRVGTHGGPAAGEHNFYRGTPPVVYDAQTRQTIRALERQIDAPAALRVWEAALDSVCQGPPVWIHGDVAPGNLLVQEGRLSAVIDFGGCAVGDPACDLVIAWTLLSGESRRAFRAALPLDTATWARARGWALWKALITAADPADAAKASEARRVLLEVLSDPLALA